MYQHGKKLAKPQSSIVSRKLKFLRKIKQLQSMMKAIRSKRLTRIQKSYKKKTKPGPRKHDSWRFCNCRWYSNNNVIDTHLQKILQEVTQTENDEVEEIEDDDGELVAPSTRDAENWLEILKNLSIFSEKRGDQMQDLTLSTRDKMQASAVKRKVQASKNYELFCKRKINLHCHTFTIFMFIGSFTQIRLDLLEAFSWYPRFFRMYPATRERTLRISLSQIFSWCNFALLKSRYLKNRALLNFLSGPFRARDSGIRL